jgi:hypothetical protein
MELYGRSTAGRLEDSGGIAGRRLGEQEQRNGQHRALKISFGSKRIVFGEGIIRRRPRKGLTGPGGSVGTVDISQWTRRWFVFPAITGFDDAGSGQGRGEGTLQKTFYPAIMKQRPGEEE